MANDNLASKKTFLIKLLGSKQVPIAISLNPAHGVLLNKAPKPPPTVAIKPLQTSNEQPCSTSEKVVMPCVSDAIVDQEKVLKQNVVKVFNQQGVYFEPVMIQAINDYFAGINKIFADYIVALNAKVLSLQEQIASKVEAEKLDESNKSSSNEKPSKQLHKLKHTLLELGKKFLSEVGDGIDEVIKQQGVQAQDLKCEKSEENIGSLSKSLHKLISESDLQTIEMNMEALEDLRCLLLSYFPLDTDSQGNALLQDVNMGFEVKIPALATNASAPKPITSLLKRGIIMLPDLPTYLQKGDMIINDFGDRPIHRDVIKNNIIEVKKQCIVLKLRSLGLDICNEECYTPLHLAVRHDASVEIISTLLHYGADFRARDGDGNTVLHLGAEADTLAKLFHASVRAHVDARCYGRVVDVANNDGFTALHVAAMRGSAPHVRLLLAEAGAAVDVCDTKSGRTALHHAVENNDVEVVMVLKEYNADVDIRTYNGTSIIDVLTEVEVGFSHEMRKLFYNERLRTNAKHVDEPAAPISRRKRSKKALIAEFKRPKL